MILLTVGRADVTEKLQSAALTITGNVEQGKATLYHTLPCLLGAAHAKV